MNENIIFLINIIPLKNISKQFFSAIISVAAGKMIAFSISLISTKNYGER